MVFEQAYKLGLVIIVISGRWWTRVQFHRMQTNWSRICLQTRPPLHVRVGVQGSRSGSVQNTDCFSDSLVSWFLRMSSSVMARSTASLNSVLLSRASQRTLPAREVTYPKDTVAEWNVQVLEDDDSPPKRSKVGCTAGNNHFRRDGSSCHCKTSSYLKLTQLLGSSNLRSRIRYLWAGWKWVS